MAVTTRRGNLYD